MEDVLELYEEGFDRRHPVVCFDERPVQLVAETRTPLEPAPGRRERFDYEYRRCGTANLYLMLQPLRGWRHVTVTGQRTNADFAHQMKDLVDRHFPQAETIRVVLDNLNSHGGAALYQTFPPEEARRILRKLEFHYTPKHGSWLNMAEIEFSVMSRQCLVGRIPSRDKLRSILSPWEKRRNRDHATVNWRFTVSNARGKMRRLYAS
jgi:hypothetical protein